MADKRTKAELIRLLDAAEQRMEPAIPEPINYRQWIITLAEEYRASTKATGDRSLLPSIDALIVDIKRVVR